MLDAARKEGTLTWYIAQVDGETAELMGRAFTAHFPGVKVSVIRTTGQVAYERLMQDLKNNAPQCDVFSTTDISHMPALTEAQRDRAISCRTMPRRWRRRSTVSARTDTSIRPPRR